MAAIQTEQRGPGECVDAGRGAFAPPALRGAAGGDAGIESCFGQRNVAGRAVPGAEGDDEHRRGGRVWCGGCWRI